METSPYVQEATEFLEGLSDQEQSHFLLRFAYELTITARETYAVGEIGLDHPIQMRLINETMHRALGQSDTCLHGSQQRFSVETLTGLLLRHKDDFMRDAT